MTYLGLPLISLGLNLHFQVQFDEREDVKVCTVALNDDAVFEGVESFHVELSMPVYALLGTNTRAVVNVNDTEDEPTLEFHRKTFHVNESAGVVRVPVERKGTRLKTDGAKGNQIGSKRGLTQLLGLLTSPQKLYQMNNPQKKKKPKGFGNSFVVLDVKNLLFVQSNPKIGYTLKTISSRKELTMGPMQLLGFFYLTPQPPHSFYLFIYYVCGLYIDQTFAVK